MRQTRSVLRLDKWSEGAHNIGEEAEAAESMHGGLGWPCFLFSVKVRDEGDVDAGKVLMADAKLKLSHRLNEGCRLDVADCATKLETRSVAEMEKAVRNDEPQ